MICVFTCLEILPEREGLLAKICEKIKPSQPEREYVQVKGATPFLRLKVKENNVDWRKISACLTSGERKLLAPSDFPVPDGIRLSNCMPKALGVNMMFAAFLKIAEEVGKPREISVSVYDRECFLSSRLEKLVPFVRNISVYTEKIREYFYVSAKIMEESGMSIKINEYTSHAFPEKIIIADEYSRDMRNADFVFLGDNSVISYNTVTGNGICLENELKILKGEAIDDFLFASALYEYNNAVFLADRDFLTLSLAGREVKPVFIAESLVRQGNT